MAYKATSYDNHLTFRYISKKIKNCGLMCLDKNCEKFFFSVWKMFEKVNKKHTTYNKAYLGRFIDSKRLKNVIFQTKFTSKSVNIAWNVKIVKNVTSVKMM